MAINGIALGAAGVGALFLYGGLKGKSPLAALQSVIQGQSPATAAQSQGFLAIPGTTGGQVGKDTFGAPVPSNGSVQQIFHATANQFGWGTGNEWASLNQVEMHEAGYDPTAYNSSGAFGLAQALGHGNSNTQGTVEIKGMLHNAYGGYGLSDSDAQKANNGDPATQALWMMHYIKSRYGTPSAAWAQYCTHGQPNPCWY